MIDLTEYQKLKDEVEEAKSEADRASGGIGQLKEQLRKEYGCNTVKEGELLLEEEEEKEEKAAEEFNKALKVIKEKFGDNLDRGVQGKG